MNIRDRISYLIQKYEQSPTAPKNIFGKGQHTIDFYEAHNIETKQLYLDDFDAAVA